VREKAYLIIGLW